MASTAVFTVLVAVIMTTGIRGWLSRSSLSSSMPSFWGMMMSRKMRSGSSLRIFSQASLALPAAMTW